MLKRMQDTLKVSGVQVSPTEIEAVLKAHPNAYLSDSCVAGVPGPRDDGELVPRWVRRIQAPIINVDRISGHGSYCPQLVTKRVRRK